eukprot:TRINITY_DN2248_c0_g1_i1.p1 TRINITY_DN2248_c0_g1~~TRINITY_DN2248_c0_g1_i1.p1  ORF type:complete len:143 (+),score=3.75 TRINITY_DN2248_c0_g1_i1:98-526(+)
MWPIFLPFLLCFFFFFLSAVTPPNFFFFFFLFFFFFFFFFFFHLSLTVLVHYRSLGSIQPWKMVLPDSHKVSRVSWYSGTPQGDSRFRVPDYHRLWSAFPCRSAISPQSHVGAPQPPQASLWVWAIPRSLATTCGISIDFFS